MHSHSQLLQGSHHVAHIFAVLHSTMRVCFKFPTASSSRACPRHRQAARFLIMPVPGRTQVRCKLSRTGRQPGLLSYKVPGRIGALQAVQRRSWRTSMLTTEVSPEARAASRSVLLDRDLEPGSCTSPAILSILGSASWSSAAHHKAISGARCDVSARHTVYSEQCKLVQCCTAHSSQWGLV